MKRASVLILIMFVSADLFGQPVTPPPAREGWCATSPARTELLRARHEWLESRRIQTRATVPARIMRQDGLFIVEADEAILVNDDRLDLVGRTVRMTAVADGYSTVTIPIEYRDDIGDLVVDFSLRQNSHEFSAPEQAHETLALPFSFPFHGSSYERLFVTDQNGIYFSEPRADRPDQYEATDAAAIEQPMISPLLFSQFPRTFVPPRVYANVSTEDAVITWRTDSKDFAYDIQARLSADGSIDLSWRSARDVEWGAVVVTPGSESAALGRETIFSLDDPTLDSSGGRSDFDLTGIDVERLAGTDLVEVRLSLRGVVRQNAISDGAFVQYGVDSGASGRVVIHLTNDQDWIYFPDRGWVSSPGSLSLASGTVRFLVADRYLTAGESVPLNVWIYDSASRSRVDELTGSFSHDHSSERFELNLDSIGSRLLDRPIVETFTLPDMDPYEIWDRISETYGISPDGPDAIAVYQNFFTDLVLYAGAYSTVGNPGADGVSDRPGYGSGDPRFPALLHMSRLGYRYNSAESSSVHVLNHEFGHRWLYFFEIMEEGEARRSLNPAGGHPAQFVHTPAAFDVRGVRNSSAMGGSWFEDLGDGTFRARNPLASYGYSWHELYLMGLAAPEEVEPWYYIANSDPQLGDAYYPPDGIVVSGERRDVTIGQVIEAMGERSPGVESSRKRFQTFFVLLVRDLDAVTEAEIADLEERRRLLHEAIPVATGGRASVQTRHGETFPRSRGIRRP